MYITVLGKSCNTLFPRKPKKPDEMEMETKGDNPDVAPSPEPEPEPVSAISYLQMPSYMYFVSD